MEIETTVYLNSKQVAKLFRVSTRTLQTWRTEGLIPFLTLPKGQIRYDAKVILKIFKEK